MQAATLSLAVGEGGAVSLDLRAAGRPRRAWVTLLSTDSYLRGVQCLARALRAHRSRYPLVVMVTGSVGEDSCAALRAESNCTLRVVEYIRVPSEARARYACAHFADCWTKLSAWAWVEYEQLCYLDADMLPLASLDELLETDVPAGVPLLAVPDCACRQRAMRPHCPFAATPAGGPPRLVRRYFNAGLLVFRPSRDEHAALLQELVAADAATLPFAEQDLLNRRYSLKWMPLSVNYNATKGIWLHHRQRPRGPASAPTAAPEVAMAEGELAPFELELSSVRNLHYTMAKPWQLRNPLNKGFGQINQLWWDAFLRGAPGKGGKGVRCERPPLPCAQLVYGARVERGAGCVHI
ncbi:nucleotide-diphospho-sugar transferase [Pavlovales sp. CCMP2436]|nr:nucleotide-diphospho-sugar transferase [Pavlovales sp. CCMP2436]